MPEDWGDDEPLGKPANKERTIPEPPGGYNKDYAINNDVDSKVQEVNPGSSKIRDPFGVDEGRPNRTPTQSNPEAAKYIGKARNQLDDALAEYRSYAGRNSTIVEVNAANTDFESIRVESLVDKAESTLDKAVEPATEGQKMNILALKHVSVFVRHAARCQKALGDAYEEVSFMADRLYNENLLLVDQGNRQAESALQKAREAYSVVKSEVEPDAFAAYGTISEGMFEEKRRQLDAEIAALDEARGGLRDMKGGVKQLQTGVPAFLDEKYQLAERRFSSANADFAIARTSFSLTRGSREVEKKVNEITGVARTLEQATKDLRRAARAQLNDERLVFYEARRAAEEHINSNDIVRRMRTMNDIVT
jgi:predicted RNA-binding protein with PIN domain